VRLAITQVRPEPHVNWLIHSPVIH
jgi:hypothetical protein